MRALCWESKRDVRVKDVPDPQILNPRDAIVEVSLAAICGSDLHLYNGVIPTMKAGDILGHEFVGRVVEIGSGVRNLRIGDRVVVPFAIACGECHYCSRDQWSLCDNSNPNGALTQKLYGHASGGIFGYSHMMGGYAGGQAEYVRVPFADSGALPLPDTVPDDKALFLADVLPTAYMAAENCSIEPDDVVAVWGAGPVGLLAMKCAYLLGAGRVIAIDHIPSRLLRARDRAQAEIINYKEVDVLEALREMTAGRGPDSCIDAVGMEADGHGIAAMYHVLKQKVRAETDRPTALVEAIHACRKGGTLSVPGVYGGLVDKFPLGTIFSKGLSLKGGQTHVHRYLRPLLRRIMENEIDPTFVVTHRIPLEAASEAYALFQRRDDDCIKVLLEP